MNMFDVDQWKVIDANFLHTFFIQYWKTYQLGIVFLLLELFLTILHSFWTCVQFILSVAMHQHLSCPSLCICFASNLCLMIGIDECADNVQMAANVRNARILDSLREISPLLDSPVDYRQYRNAMHINGRKNSLFTYRSLLSIDRLRHIGSDRLLSMIIVSCLWGNQAFVRWNRICSWR
jgi:hypothetical protein